MKARLGVLTLLLTCAVSCQQLDKPDEFVARVGDAYLLRSDLDANLSELSTSLDTTQIRKQIIDQWVNTELLHQEALRLRLSNREDIQRHLDESVRAVLIEGLISEYHQQAVSDITAMDIITYYETNKEYLRLLEPFVHIRYLSHPRQDSLELARSLLRSEVESDSGFVALLERFSASVAEELAMTQNYFPETKLFVHQPDLNQLLQTTPAGAPPQLVMVDSMYHLLQVVDRSPVGTIPELLWVEDLVREQLILRRRKQNYARNVRELFVEAESREDIEIRW